MQGQMGEKTRAKDINLEYYLLLIFNRFGFLRHWESGTPSKNDPPERVEELMIVAMRRRCCHVKKIDSAQRSIGRHDLWFHRGKYRQQIVLRTDRDAMGIHGIDHVLR